MNRTARRPVVAAAAALALLLAAAPAHAAPTKRVLNDPVEPAKRAYDITKVVLKSQATEAGAATVTVRHGRAVKTGDTVDLWLDLDGDPDPDIHVVGDSFSEYSVFRTSTFLEDGKDISNKGCAALKMEGRKSVLSFDPACLKAGETFRVSVKSSRSDKPARTADFAPAAQKFSKRVLSGPIA